MKKWKIKSSIWWKDILAFGKQHGDEVNWFNKIIASRDDSAWMHEWLGKESLHLLFPTLQTGGCDSSIDGAGVGDVLRTFSKGNTNDSGS